MGGGRRGGGQSGARAWPTKPSLQLGKPAWCEESVVVLWLRVVRRRHGTEPRAYQERKWSVAERWFYMDAYFVRGNRDKSGSMWRGEVQVALIN